MVTLATTHVNPSHCHHVFVFQHNYSLCALQLLLRGFTPFIVVGGPAPQCLSNIQMGRRGDGGFAYETPPTWRAVMQTHDTCNMFHRGKDQTYFLKLKYNNITIFMSTGSDSISNISCSGGASLAVGVVFNPFFEQKHMGQKSLTLSPSPFSQSDLSF